MNSSTPIKVMVAAHRLSGMSHEAHLRYFEHVHGAKVLDGGAAVLAGISKYVQDHVFDSVHRGAGAGYDSVGELWFADQGALQSVMSHPYTRDTIRPDEANFSESSTLLVSMVSEEAVAVSAPRNSNTKLMHFMYKNAGLDAAAFTGRWRASCAAILQTGELSSKVRRFVRNHPLPLPPEAQPPNPCDGINCLWLDRGEEQNVLEAYERAFAQANAKDGPLIDPLKSFILLAREIPIHPVAG